MRLAGHLGVRAPDAPLFRHTAGSTDPLAQIAFMAGLGFAGIFDHYLCLRSPDDQQRIGDALRQHGMAMGSFVHDPLNWNQPTWLVHNAAERNVLREAMDVSLAAAKRSGGKTVNCITGLQPDLSFQKQCLQMADNLGRLGDRASAAGITLCVEVTHPSFAPGLLIERWWEACELVRAVDHSAVMVNLDIGHVALHGDDVIAAIEGTAGLLGMVQIADVPGRVEPGAGTLDWKAIAEALDRANYRGLVELELEPVCEGETGERAMMLRLADLGII